VQEFLPLPGAEMVKEAEVKLCVESEPKAKPELSNPWAPQQEEFYLAPCGFGLNANRAQNAETPRPVAATYPSA
jgi:hypothetical protein